MSTMSVNLNGILVTSPKLQKCTATNRKQPIYKHKCVGYLPPRLTLIGALSVQTLGNTKIQYIVLPFVCVCL